MDLLCRWPARRFRLVKTSYTSLITLAYRRACTVCAITKLITKAATLRYMEEPSSIKLEVLSINQRSIDAQFQSIKVANSYRVLNLRKPLTDLLRLGLHEEGPRLAGDAIKENGVVRRLSFP